MKRILVFCMIIVLLVCIVFPVLFIPVNILADTSGNLEETDIIDPDKLERIDEAITERNDRVQEALITNTFLSPFEKEMIALNETSVNESYYKRYGMLVKGALSDPSNPKSAPVIDPVNFPLVVDEQKKDDDGDYKFIGRNAAGEWIENPFYDSTTNPDIDQRNWVQNYDWETMSDSAIGSIVREDSLFTNADTIRKYYVHFIMGFYRDYYNYLSADYINEYENALSAYGNVSSAELLDSTNPQSDFDLFYDVGQGSGAGTRTNTAMGDYIRIVSIPTKTSNGVAYLFHKKGNTVFYLSVLLVSEQLLDETLKGLHLSGNINAPTTVDHTTTSLNGTLDFAASSEGGIVSYALSNISANTTINDSLSGTVSGDSSVYSRSIPITINIPGTSADVSIDITCTDTTGLTKTITVTHSINKTTSGPTVTGDFTSSATSVLKADTRGAEQFDITKGIPTGENLYANVLTAAYIYEEDYKQIIGIKNYTVNMTKSYTYKWWDRRDKYVDTDDDGIKDTWKGGYDYHTGDAPVTKTYTISRNYAYYLINQLEVYGLNSATLSNNALSGGSVTITPTGYTKPIVIASTTTAESDHIKEATHYSVSHLNTTNNIYETITYNPTTNVFNITLKTEEIGGRSSTSKPSQPNENFTLIADSAITPVEVRNDQVIFNGTTILDDNWYEETTKAPSNIPTAPQTNNNILYKTGLTIPNTTLNASHTTTGNVTYNRILSINTVYNETINQPINHLNNVVVHTPVVCYPNIITKESTIQLLNTNTTLTQLKIGENFTVNYSTIGQHKNIPGYGNRNYNKTTGQRQIQFSFDIYTGEDDTGIYYESGKWIDYDTTLETGETTTATYYIPNWNKETETGYIMFRTLATNIPNLDADYEYHLNENLNSYKAVEKINLQLSSKIYDFKITDITDRNWNDHFNQTNSDYYVGTNNNLGEVDTSHINTLPIMKNKNTIKGYEDYSIKLGYEIKYDLKTNGDMINKTDMILITPTYYHVDKNGENREAIDIYYESTNGFIKLGSDRDTMKNTMVMNTKTRNISEEELKNTAKVLTAQNRDNGYTYTDYLNAFTGNYEKNLKYEDKIVLSEFQKTYIGETSHRPSSISETKVLESEQKWYGEYYLPNQTVIVKKGTDLSSYSKLKVGRDPFITDGYIIVNFEIKGYHNVDKVSYLSNPEVYEYIGYETRENGNQWEVEGYDRSQEGVTLYYGDVAYYHVDLKASDDYE